MALIASRLDLVWIATVCGKPETRYRSSNTLGWNTLCPQNVRKCANGRLPEATARRRT